MKPSLPSEDLGGKNSKDTPAFLRFKTSLIFMVFSLSDPDLIVAFYLRSSRRRGCPECRLSSSKNTNQRKLLS
jgi:hypothetical protein